MASRRWRSSAGTRQGLPKRLPIDGWASSIGRASRVRRSSPASLAMPVPWRQRWRGIRGGWSGSSWSIPRSLTRPTQAAAALDAGGLRGMCLFPAMHRFAIHDDRVRRLFEVAAARPGTVVFVHCGVLTVGVRSKLGLPSPFDIRYGNPARPAGRRGGVPHGAGHHSALRGRALSRSVDGRGHVRQRAAGHLELQQLDQVLRWRPHARGRVPPGAFRGRRRSSALRQRFVVLSTRLGERTSSKRNPRRSTRSAPRRTSARRSSAAISIACSRCLENQS